MIKKLLYTIGKVLYIIGVVLLIYLAWESYEPPPEDERLMRGIVAKVARQFKQKYQLRSIGISEGSDGKHYTEIGIHFEIGHLLSKEEARKILIESAEELLRQVNADPVLVPQLNPSPFTMANIEIFLFIHHPDGKSVFYPNICCCTLARGVLRYRTKIPEEKYGYYTEEEESYEEALKLLHSDEEKRSVIDKT